MKRGGSCAHKNHIGMYRVQESELQYDERQEKSSRPYGDEEVL